MVVVIKSWTSAYPDAITLKKGTFVRLLEKEADEKWQNRAFCSSEGKQGWVPNQFINTTDGNSGVITEDYSARELDVTVNDRVKVIRELNGWLWVRHFGSGEEGWIPRECIGLE